MTWHAKGGRIRGDEKSGYMNREIRWDEKLGYRGS